MSVYNCTYIRSLLIHSHVHFDLGRRTEVSVCLDYVSFGIYFTDVLRSHETFGNTGRGAKEFIVVQFYGNVSIVCSNHVPVINAFADVADLFFDFILVNSHENDPPYV